MLKRTAACSQSRQLYTPVRLPFGSIHAATRHPAAGTRSTAVDQPATEAAPAELVSAEPPEPAATAVPLVAAAAVDVESPPHAAAVEAETTDRRRPIVKVSRSTDKSALAGYIERLLKETSDNTVLVRAVGAAAVEVALKALTRATEIVQKNDSSSTLTFTPQRKRIGANRIDISTVVATDFWVTKVPTAEVPRDIPDDLHPLVMKDTTDSAAVEQYIMYAVRQPGRAVQSGPLGYMLVAGPQFPQKFSAAVTGIINSRLNLVDARKADLTVTISRITIERRRRTDGQQQQQPAEETDPAVDDTAAQATSSSDDSEAADGTSTEPLIRTRYFIQVHVCKPRERARRPRAAARSGRDQSSTTGSGGSSGRRGREPSSRAQGTDQIAAAAEEGAKPSGAGPSRKTPGMIEVPEEEWNQLKEQLEVVPHLTEQLQVMTRQHEQLLSLLAGQQQGTQQ